MKDEENGSSGKRMRRLRLSPSDDALKDAKIEPLQSEGSDSRFEIIDWEKTRFTAYAITGQVQVVKEIEEDIKTQLRAMSSTEWVGIPDALELALGMAHTLAAQWLIQNIDWGPLKAYMYALTRRLAAVDEITQTVMESIIRMRADAWVGVEDRAQYLKTIVFNAALDWKKRENSQQYKATALLESDKAQTHDTGDVAVRACAMEDVSKLLKKLTRRVRQAFILHKGLGCSVKETAARMSVSEETIKGYIKEAVREFSKLEDHQANLRRARKRGRREDTK